MARETMRPVGMALVRLCKSSRLRRVAGGLLVAFVLIGVVFPLACSDRLTYWPKHDGDWDARLHTPYKIDEVTIPAHNANIVGWYLQQPTDPHAVLLYLHGNTGDIARRIGRIQAYGSVGWNVLMIDYPGYGRSSGRPSEEGCRNAAFAACGWLLRQGYPRHQIAVLGESLGTGPAVELAAAQMLAGGSMVGALILQSPYTSTPAVLHERVPFMPWDHFMLTRFDNLSRITDVTVPITIFAGEMDDEIPFHQSKELFDAAPQPKTFIDFPDADHKNLFLRHRAEYLTALKRVFLQVQNATDPVIPDYF